MKFFRIQNEEASDSSLKYVLFSFVILLIVGSFFLQLSMGLCPVP